MGPITFAFSVSHFINSVGADAGFASMIGLSILILLYFAQARETASLREQAHEAAQRVQQLERRIAQSEGEPASPAVPPPGTSAAVARAAAAAPVPAAAERSSAPASVAAAGRSAAVAPAPPAARSSASAPVSEAASGPIAPAGVGAPGLTAATRLIPEAGGQPAAALGAIAVSQPPVENTSVVGPPPATVAGGANGTRGPGARGAVPLPSPPRAQVRPGGPSTPGTRGPRPEPDPPAAAARPGSSRPRRALTAGLALLAAAAIVAGLLVLTSQDGSRRPTATATTPAPTGNASASQAGAGHRAPAPASITVAVLNGTATSGLAHRVAVKLGAAGFKRSTVATAADQTRTATIVGYLAGHRRDALVVASALKLGPRSISPVDQNSQAVACPPPGGCSAGVVVTVGSDLTNRP